MTEGCIVEDLLVGDMITLAPSDRYIRVVEGLMLARGAHGEGCEILVTTRGLMGAGTMELPLPLGSEVIRVGHASPRYV